MRLRGEEANGAGVWRVRHAGAALAVETVARDTVDVNGRRRRPAVQRAHLIEHARLFTDVPTVIQLEPV